MYDSWRNDANDSKEVREALQVDTVVAGSLGDTVDTMTDRGSARCGDS